MKGVISMKKIICLLLILVMLTGLCGCFGGQEVEDIRGDIVDGNTIPDTQPQEEEPEFSMGKATENTYRNDFLGISCTLPEQWAFYSEEQILQMNNYVGTVIDEDVAQQLKDAAIIYDMCAVNEAEGYSINVNLEKLNALQLIGLDIKQNLEAQIDTILSSYESMGYTDTTVTYAKIQVDGQEFDGLKLYGKIQGLDFFLEVFTFRKGSYLANVTVSSFETDQNETILSYFTIDE